MERSGGLIGRDDLAAYRPSNGHPSRARIAASVSCRWAPPSSGGVALVEILNILEGYPLADYGPNASQTIHLSPKRRGARTPTDRAGSGIPGSSPCPSRG